MAVGYVVARMGYTFIICGPFSYTMVNYCATNQ